MKDTTEALNEIQNITDEACAGKLTEEQCKQRFAAFIEKFGDDLILPNTIGDLKNEPASKEKLEKLLSIQERGGTSEETFIEIARTGRTLRKRKIIKEVAIIAAIAAIIGVIIAIISLLKN